MIKRLTLKLKLESVRYPGQLVLKVLFRTDSLRDWCLGLCLLKESLVKALIVTEDESNKQLEIRMLDESAHPIRSRGRMKPRFTLLTIARNDLDCLVHFYLKYYRDGVGEVDHLDLDVLCDSESQEMSIVFNVPKALEPISPDEARKRLGLA